MKQYILNLTIIVISMNFAFSNNQNLTDKQINQITKEFLTIVWTEAMNAKNATNIILPNIREELLENLCSSAPAVQFETHADLSDSLTQAENTSASIFISTDNQNTWYVNDSVGPINQPGYETTWGATTITDGGENVD